MLPVNTLCRHLPVNARLPRSVGEAIEHVQDKGSCKPGVAPIFLGIQKLRRNAIDTGPRLNGLGPLAGVGSLELVTAAPHNHDQGKKRSPCNLGAHCAADALKVEGEAKDVGTDNLHRVVNHTIERAGSSVKVGSVDLGEVVGVEPVGGQEHGEQGQDIRVSEEGLPEAHDFRGPRWVLHDNDLGAILTNDVLCIDEGPGEGSTDQGEDQETNIGAIADSDGGCAVDALTEGDLRGACQSYVAH